MRDRTEAEHAPSPRRRDEARRQGRVARSRELVFAILYAACGIVFIVYGPTLVNSLQRQLAHGLETASVTDVDASELLPQAIADFGWLLLPILTGIMLATVLAHWIQHGPLWLPNRIRIEVQRVNPWDGLGRLLDVGTFGGLALATIKVVVLTTLMLCIIRNQWEHVLALPTAASDSWIMSINILFFRVAAWLGIGLVIWGGIDFAWNLFRYERELWMTADELRDDVKPIRNDVNSTRRRHR